MPSVAAAKTPSKINLFLAVEGRRPDGYHDISTLFLPLESPCDELEVSIASSPGVRLSCDCPLVPLDQGNLCVKAALAYCEAAGLSPALSISLRKGIPVAAGLGGGSSDAARTLDLLNGVYKALGRESLHSIAKSLGADVPFFLDPRPSAGHGVGELLKPLPFAAPELPILVVAPNFPVSAAWAYKSLDWAAAKADGRSLDEAVDALRAGDLKAVAKLMRNDLSHAVRAKFPLIGIIESRLLELGALAAQVSGSGPSVYALFPSKDSLAEAKAALAASGEWSASGVF